MQKSEDLNSEDFVQCGKTYNLDKNTVLDIIDRTSEIIKEWPSFAKQANLSEERMNEIKGHHNELLFRK